MVRMLFAFVLAFASFGSVAQFVPIAGASAPPSASPEYTMPPSKIYIKTSTIPKRRIGRDAIRIHSTPGSNVPNKTIGGAPDEPYNAGAFRVLCGISHYSFDDPIVRPGQSGMTHLHVFFGNTLTSAQTTDFSKYVTQGESTCDGGLTNRSGYWSPVFIYHCPVYDTRGCDHARDGEVIPATQNNAYYKAEGLGSNDNMEWVPVGFRMIAGNASSTVPLEPTVGKFSCQITGDGGAGHFFDHIPSTAEVDALAGATPSGNCTEMIVLVGFPQCWDGVNLDSPGSHNAHLRYAQGEAGCTPYGAAFSHRIPTISYNVHYVVAKADWDYIRLSSDPPLSSGQPAGWTLHGDYVMGWDQDPNFGGFGKGKASDILMKNCLNKGNPVITHTDCHDDGLGDILGDGGNWVLF